MWRKLDGDGWLWVYGIGGMGGVVGLGLMDAGNDWCEWMGGV